MVTLAVDGNMEDLAVISGILLEIDPDGNHIKVETGEKALGVAAHYQIDIVFLEADLPDGDGIGIAEKILIRQPETNIVFITRNPDCAVRAFDIYASAYLMKSVTEQDIRRTIRNLRYPIKHQNEDTKRLQVRCFGTFEAYVNGIPLTFERTKTKQLLAYLIDRQGDICDIQQMVCALWPESDGGPAATNYLRRLMSDLQSVLSVHGVGEAVIRYRGKMGINKDLVDCDYYDYITGKPDAASSFKGEYMSQYSMGEMTLAALTMNRASDLHPVTEKENIIKVMCFGRFEVYFRDEPIIFSRKKSKELFAYLIDRQGAVCSAEEIAAVLWNDSSMDCAKHNLRTVYCDLKKTLADAGMEDVLIKDHRQIALRKPMVDCDYWKAVSGQIRSDDHSPDSYMQNYSWAELTRESLRGKIYNLKTKKNGNLHV
ncbi:MAG: response regulator [Butyrivibrio sp.]|nr:response regulator [Butyrivibrio sp.]